MYLIKYSFLLWMSIVLLHGWGMSMTKIDIITSELKGEIPELLNAGSFILPTESELCTQYNCSRQTIRKVLDNLRGSGLISSRQGSGHRLTGLMPDSGRNYICLLLASPDSYIFPALIYDFQRDIAVRSDLGLAVSVSDMKNDFYKERIILTEMLQNPPRAIIAECMSCMPNPNADLYKELESMGCIIMFLFGNYPNMSQFPSVTEATYDAVYDIVVRINDKTPERRIYGVFRDNNPQEVSKLYGFISALRDNGRSFAKKNYYIAVDNDDIPKALLDTVSYSEQMPVIIFANDELAYSSMRYLESKKGRKAGGLVSDDADENLIVYSFDNSYLRNTANYNIQSLAHSRQPLHLAISERITGMIKGQPKYSVVLPFDDKKDF